MCASDEDCDNLPQLATCGTEGQTKGYCVDEDGIPVELLPTVEIDFAATGIDEELFRYELGADLRNNELQTYTSDETNVFVEGDELVFAARFDEATGEYTSGSLELVEPMRFGRLEATFRSDVGSGASPSFWLLPDAPGDPETTCVDGLECAESTWPVWGGIVVLSGRADGSTIMGLSYATEEDGVLNLREAMTSVPDSLSASESHHFALEWGPKRMNWYVDHELVHSADLGDALMHHPGGIHPFLQEFRIKLNLAVGGLTEDPISADYPRETRVSDLRILEYTGQ